MSGDFNVNPQLSVGAYYGRAAGKSVIEAIYPQGKNANYGFLEMMFKF